MARTKKAAAAAKTIAAPTIDPAIHAPSGQPWAYGLRTWDKSGVSRGSFRWDLTPGARTTAPDWKPTQECGYGLHCNAWGAEDWSLMGNLSDVMSGEKVLGVVRYDPADAIDLSGKHKAEWMEVVLTTLTADLGTVLGFMSPKRISYIQGLTKVQEGAAATTGYRSAAATTGNYSAAATTGNYSAAATTGYRSAAATTGNYSAAATTGEGSAAATTGNYSAAATTGYRSAAATTGYRSAAATTGNYSAAATTGEGSAAATTGEGSIAAALGVEGKAKAGEGGAIMLAAYATDWSKSPPRELKAVFAGMVGETHGGVTIQANTYYRLTADGALEVVGA